MKISNHSKSNALRTITNESPFERYPSTRPVRSPSQFFDFDYVTLHMCYTNV